MPNWCENFLTFMSNGTEQGNLALIDFHTKLRAVQKKNMTNGLWECHVEDFLTNVDMSNGLFEYVGKIKFNKRGYISSISDINYNSFHVVTYDAWSANNAFWVELLTMIYGNLITFTYIANEPGMQLFYTNNTGVLPRYNASFYINNIADLMKVPGAWNPNLSNNVFLCLDINNPYLYYRQSPYKYTNEYDMPRNDSFEFILELDGDDDDVISEFEDYVFKKDLSDVSNVNELASEINKLDLGDNFAHQEFNYVPLEEDVAASIVNTNILGGIRRNSENKDLFYQKVNNAIDEYSQKLDMDLSAYKLPKGDDKSNG